MGKKKNSNIKKTAQQLNNEYLMSFASTRGSLGMLRVAWAGMFFAGMDCLMIWWTLIDSNIRPWTSIWMYIIIINFVFMTICVILSYIPRILYKYQMFSSFMFVIFTLLLPISIQTTIYIILRDSDDYINGLNFGDMISKIYLICILLIYVISLVYNYFWLKNQLKEGFSENRVLKNYSTKSIVYSPKSLSIIGGISLASIAIGSLAYYWQ
ncbi:hypothetical protein BG261_09010 [Floricoccus tropicus]|uniref:Uncharacterized protein n=1 Tax=Floricoccus tropicus TaxID=1859473 RepID=A0A1E8GPT7_9LACT|nr:hypothetical protein [Floricoccus tropicus]OFI50249.1 hypothetical protein BG261_09010 [Floricoccus tropicus]